MLGISGSPRKNGNTDIIIREMLRGADDAGIKTELIFLRDYVITPCIGCEKCRKDKTCSQYNDGMNLLYPKIEAADHIILGSPVYHYNITSQMKSFIDRLYPYYIFSDDRPRRYQSRLADTKRSSLIFSICEQTDKKEEGFAIEAMSRPLEALSYHIWDTLPLCGFFEKGSILQDVTIMETAYKMGREFAAYQ